MLKNKVFTRTLKVAQIIYFSLLIIFGILIIVDKSLIFGWLVGGLASIISFIIGTFLIECWDKKSRTKMTGFWIGSFRTFIQMVFQAGIFLIVLFVNSKHNSKVFFDGNFSSLIKPINIFTYMAGIGLITTSVIISQLVFKRKDL